MARLGDVGPVLKKQGTWAFCKKVWQEVNEDNLVTWAAALAYSWLFAIFPFLIVLMSLIGHLPTSMRESARNLADGLVSYTLPDRASGVVMDNVDQIIREPGQSGILSVSLLIALVSASGGMSSTMAALDQCYDIQQGRPFWWHRLIAFGLTLIVAAMILLILVLVPLGTLMTGYLLHLGTLSALDAVILVVCRYAAAMVLTVMVLAMTYYFGPSIQQRFQIFSPGAIFSIVIWLLLGLGFRCYLDNFDRFDQRYGTVAGVAILMLIFYLDATVLLIGAEINSEIDFTVTGLPPGSRDFRRKAPKPAELPTVSQ